MVGGTHRAALLVLMAGLACPPLALARTWLVRPGESIRTTLEAASPGDRIEVFPGVYHEGAPGDLNALTVTAAGIELAGLPRPGHPVVLENPGGQSYGIWVSPADSAGAAAQADEEHPPCATSGARLAGFSLSGFTVRGFSEHGVHLACVDDFSVTKNVSDGNEVYGLFPIFSTKGVLADNEVVSTGKDAAVYVGQSDDVLITRNRVHDSLLGIEVQNSRHCSVIGNDVHDNTLGILVDIAAGTIVKTQETTVVSRNRVYENNRANSAEPGDIMAVLPSGIGILLVGADTSTVSLNRVTSNNFAGIGVVSLCLGLALEGLPCDGLDVDPFPDGNRVVHNLVQGNGTVPTGTPLDAFLADLAWDGSGTGNCWEANSFGTSVPPVLPACP